MVSSIESIFKFVFQCFFLLLNKQDLNLQTNFLCGISRWPAQPDMSSCQSGFSAGTSSPGFLFLAQYCAPPLPLLSLPHHSPSPTWACVSFKYISVGCMCTHQPPKAKHDKSSARSSVPGPPLWPLSRLTTDSGPSVSQDSC